jgi:hypothetical protein
MQPYPAILSGLFILRLRRVNFYPNAKKMQKKLPGTAGLPVNQPIHWAIIHYTGTILAPAAFRRIRISHTMEPNRYYPSSTT